MISRICPTCNKTAYSENESGDWTCPYCQGLIPVEQDDERAKVLKTLSDIVADISVKYLRAAPCEEEKLLDTLSALKYAINELSKE